MQLDVRLRAPLERRARVGARTDGAFWNGFLARGGALAKGAITRVAFLGGSATALLAAVLPDAGFLTLGDPTRRLFCALLGAAWVLRAHASTRCPAVGAPRPVIGLFLPLALLLLVLRAPAAAVGPLVAVTLLLAARKSTAALRLEARVAAWAVAALGLWRWSVDTTTLGWHASALAAEGWSRLGSLLAGATVTLGSDLAGAPIVVALATAAARTALGGTASGRLRSRACLAMLAAPLVVVAATLALAALTRWVPESPAPAVICLRHLLLFASLLPVLALFAPRAAFAADDASSPVELPQAGTGGDARFGKSTGEEQGGFRLLLAGPRLPAVIIALCALVCVALWIRQPLSPAGKRIGIFTQSSTPWLPSTEAGYGGVAAATLGDCEDLLTALGARVERLDGLLTQGRLAALDAVILPTPSRAFSSEEQAALDLFVRRGGGLMALAEHTDLAGNRRHLNPILKRFGIAINNDSALAVAGEPWRTAIATRPHPILPGEATPDRHGLAIGASLSVRAGARPLLVGRGLFADAAAPGPELGDLIYARPERLGDVVLAATATPGLGRVLVFGDPSPLMNYPLHSTDAFLARAVGWLTGGPSGFAWALVLGFFACGALALLLLPIRSRGTRLLAAALAGPLVTLLLPTTALARLPELPAGRAALIDTSHRPALATSDAFTTSTAGLARNLRRAGYLPTRMDRFDAKGVARAGALLLLSPTRDFSPDEIRAVEQMLAGGGTLLVAMGGTEQPPIPRLTRFLGARVLPTPLGPVTAPGCCFEARFPSAWAVEAESPAYQTLCQQWGHAVVVEARRGSGRVVLLADPAVLLGDHLEGHERFDAGNIALLQHLLRQTRLSAAEDATVSAREGTRQ